MSSPDRGSGPQITQDVLYQVTGTHVIVAATIYGINANGTVNLVFFNAAGATSATNVPYSAGVDGTAANDNKWSYPAFQ